MTGIAMKRVRLLRVLHMIGSLEMGGAQTMVMALYRAIDREKVQFDFVVDCDEVNVFAEEIKSLGGRIFQFPKFNGRNYGKVRSVWNDFFTKHPEYKVLHSHVRSYASLYIPIAKKHGVKTIIHSHNTSNGQGLTAIGKKLLQYPLRFQADYFFGCSRIAGKWLFGSRIVRSNRYFMLKNAVDLERFAYRQDVRAAIRNELEVDDNTLLIGHVGRMHPQKNHQFLIDFFSQIADRRSDVKLALLGEGELREVICEQVRKLGLEDRVLFLGLKKNVEDYFSAMDLLVLPSVHEGLPVVIVEAQASGLACLVSDTVTKEVQLSELVNYLPITQGEAPWVDAIMNIKPTRKDVSKNIRNSGFCIKNSSDWLCDFYLDIAH